MRTQRMPWENWTMFFFFCFFFFIFYSVHTSNSSLCVMCTVCVREYVTTHLTKYGTFRCKLHLLFSFEKFSRRRSKKSCFFNFNFFICVCARAGVIHNFVYTHISLSPYLIAQTLISSLFSAFLFRLHMLFHWMVDVRARYFNAKLFNHNFNGWNSWSLYIYTPFKIATWNAIYLCHFYESTLHSVQWKYIMMWFNYFKFCFHCSRARLIKSNKTKSEKNEDMIEQMLYAQHEQFHHSTIISISNSFHIESKQQQQQKEK